MHNDIKIFVCTHFLNHNELPSLIRDNHKLYFSLQCGAMGKKRLDVDYYDDSGDNISMYNDYLNEMTGIYWLGKHYQEIGNPEYIGLAHYRRILPFTSDEIQPDNIVCAGYNLEQLENRTILDVFYHYHNVKTPINECISMLDISADMKYDMMNYFITSTTFPNLNMFIMHRDTFKLYFKFIEQILQSMVDIIESDSNIQRLSAYDRRYYGFIMERITGFWLKEISCKFNKQLIQKRATIFNIANKVNGIF